MNTRHFSLPGILVLLLSTHAMAQAVAVPEREHRRDMSYEEYSSVRENMRLRMKKMQASEGKQNAMRESGPDAHAKHPAPNSAYGKGYQNRIRPQDQADKASVDQPERVERPRFERFNRGDMMRR